MAKRQHLWKTCWTSMKSCSLNRSSYEFIVGEIVHIQSRWQKAKILLFNRLLVIKDCSESNTAFAHIIWSDILLKESVSESQQLELFSYFIMLAWLKKTQILTYPSDCICFSSEMTLIWFCFWWAGRYPPETAIKLWTAMMFNKCHVKRGAGAAAGDHTVPPLPQHLLQESQHRGSSHAQLYLVVFTNTMHYDLQVWMIAFSSCSKPRVSFPSFVFAHSSHWATFPPTFSFPPCRNWTNCFSNTPQVNLSHLSPTSIKNFSIRNTTSPTTTGVWRLCQVPGQNSISELSLLCCPYIADDSCRQLPSLLPFIAPSPSFEERGAREACPSLPPPPDGLTSPGLTDPGAQHAPARPPPHASPAAPLCLGGDASRGAK